MLCVITACFFMWGLESYAVILLARQIFHQLSYFSALFELLTIFHLIAKLNTALFSHTVWFILLLCFSSSWRYYVCYGLSLVLAVHGVIQGLLLIVVTKVSRQCFLLTLFKCRFPCMFLIFSSISRALPDCHVWPIFSLFSHSVWLSDSDLISIIFTKIGNSSLLKARELLDQKYPEG